MSISVLISISAAEEISFDPERSLSPKNTGTNIETMDQVTVTGLPPDLLSGSSELLSDILRNLPQKNSSVTETITVLPRVQIGEGQRTSENAGEILPPRISISGGRDYENLQSVDGMGINNLIDPLADNPNAIDQVPAHPQSLFIHQDLIDKVTVYDSNIPAKFGRFVGGVVDARTRLPKDQFSGKFNIRTTQDSWTKFHIDDDQKDDFESSNSFNQQPRFKKYDAGIEMDVPLGAQSGLLGSYKRLESNLELRHFNDWKTQDKTLENYFLKYAGSLASWNFLDMSAVYTPSKEDFFIPDTKNSNFTVKRGGYAFASTFSGSFWLGDYEFKASFQESENKRNAPPGFYTWRITPSKDWGNELNISRSREGGFGDLVTTQKSLQLGADLSSNFVTTGAISHRFNVGVQYVWDYGQYDREETAFVYNSAILSSEVVCTAGDPACADGEQYFGNRNVYVAQDKDARVNFFAAYLEDLLSIGPIELRPGIRISHEDFMDNTNVSHRFSGRWDLLGKDQTVITGGYNRYYGEALLTYKLREAIDPYRRESRLLDPLTGRLSEWAFENLSSTTLDIYSKLETPYSDEWTVGLIQQLWGGKLEINYLERENMDQFAREKISRVVDGIDRSFYVLNNNGSSQYAGVKIVWERLWKKHYLNLNYTYSDQEASNESYDDTFGEEELNELVWFEGDVTHRATLPRDDFYRDHVFNLIYSGQLPGGFTFTNVASYVSGFKDVSRVRLSDDQKIAQGIPLDLDVYEKRNQPDYWTFDWRLNWQTKFYRDQTMTLSLEIDNVFDRTPPVAGSDDTFELGRQVWVGMNYQF